MKKQKKQLIILLIAIFCAILLLVFIKQQNKQEQENAQQEEEEIIIDEIDTSRITAFSYYTNGEKISYQKEGESWRCINHADLQIDADKIDSLLANLGSITALEKVSDVEDLGEYGLLEPSNTITVTMEDKTLTYAVGNYNEIVAGSYVRKNDETTIYIVSGGITTAFSESPDNYVKDEQTQEEDSTSLTEEGTSYETVSDNEASEVE